MRCMNRATRSVSTNHQAATPRNRCRSNDTGLPASRQARTSCRSPMEGRADMRVAIFGAHGPTGQLLTRDILDAGHDAIAITRRPDAYPFTDPRLTVTGADATSATDVGHAI